MRNRALRLDGFMASSGWKGMPRGKKMGTLSSAASWNTFFWSLPGSVGVQVFVRTPFIGNQYKIRKDIVLNDWTVPLSYFRIRRNAGKFPRLRRFLKTEKMGSENGYRWESSGQDKGGRFEEKA